jgi:peptide-methionine (S)-S-oxide reductase
MSEKTTATATFGGGCFWCLEAVFDLLRGIHDVAPGYAGGHVDGPTYEEVCTGTTGHAEVIRITYDPTVITYRDLLEVFFSMHDPTTPDRQGNDVGPQYRSIILYESDQQKREAEEFITRLSGESVWENPIVTEVVPLEAFHPAEDYHRDYFARNSQQPYCQAVIAPKVAKMRAGALQRLGK